MSNLKPLATLNIRISQPQRAALETLAEREANTITAVARRLLSTAISTELPRNSASQASRPRPKVAVR